MVSRKYLSFFSSVLMVGTGFKGSWPNTLFLERGDAESQSARGAGSSFSLFPLSCGLCSLILTLIAQNISPCFQGSPGLFSLHTKLFLLPFLFSWREVIYVPSQFCCALTVWGRYGGQLGSYFTSGKWRKEETGRPGRRQLLLPLWRKKDKVM